MKSNGTSKLQFYNLKTVTTLNQYNTWRSRRGREVVRRETLAQGCSKSSFCCAESGRVREACTREKRAAWFGWRKTSTLGGGGHIPGGDGRRESHLPTYYPLPEKRGAAAATAGGISAPSSFLLPTHFTCSFSSHVTSLFWPNTQSKWVLIFLFLFSINYDLILKLLQTAQFVGKELYVLYKYSQFTNIL